MPNRRAEPRRPHPPSHRAVDAEPAPAGPKGLRATLSMYDLPGLEAANDAIWAAVARGLTGSGMARVPASLTRDDDLFALWTDPNLLLAHACGLPFVTLLQGRVRYVATPIYDLPGAKGGDYRSWIIVRDSGGPSVLAGLRGCIAAVNAPHSQSGANALAAVTAPLAQGQPFFAGIRITGSHRSSIDAVSKGLADCAAIDCVTWALLSTTDPARLDGLRILAGSPTAPTLPFVTSHLADDATVMRLRKALAAALHDPLAAAACRSLGLEGFLHDEAAYARILAMHEKSLCWGCSRLATVMRQAG